MKKMTLRLGFLALASATAFGTAQAQDAGAAPAATPQDLAALTSRSDAATAPADNGAPSPPLVADETQTGGRQQYYSRAQVGDAPAQTTAAADDASNSYGASLYGSSASGRREIATPMGWTAEKP